LAAGMKVAISSRPNGKAEKQQKALVRQTNVLAIASDVSNT